MSRRLLEFVDARGEGREPAKDKEWLGFVDNGSSPSVTPWLPDHLVRRQVSVRYVGDNPVDVGRLNEFGSVTSVASAHSWPDGNPLASAAVLANVTWAGCAELTRDGWRIVAGAEADESPLSAADAIGFVEQTRAPSATFEGDQLGVSSILSTIDLPHVRVLEDRGDTVFITVVFDGFGASEVLAQLRPLLESSLVRQAKISLPSTQSLTQILTALEAAT